MKFFLPLLLTSLTANAKPLSIEVVHNTAREIDNALVSAQIKQKITPNPIVDDATFVRRAFVNIIGRTPTLNEAKHFIDSKDPEKRFKIVDKLVQTPGFNSQLFNFWTDLLRVKTRNETAGLGWHVWLKNAVNKNMPYDHMVNHMLSAQGHVADNPAAGYYLRDRGMLLDNVSNTVQVFLGQQIGCAQCHDHPFDDTTQMEYFQLAAFLGGTEYRFQGGRDKIKELVGVAPGKNKNMMGMANMSRKERREMRQKMKGKLQKARDLGSVFRYHNRNALYDNPQKELKLPKDYQYDDGKPGENVKPGFLFGLETKDIPPTQRRKYFAKWVTSPKNPYFTKVIANRLWKQAFGYGLVANPDDWSNSPDPLFPEIVDLLEKAMIAADYDLKQYLRILYQTKLFQRQVTSESPAPGFSFHFAGPALRRLSGPQLRDSLITLLSGNIDHNTDESLQKSWTKYVTSFKALMKADQQQLAAIDKASDYSEVERRKVQKEISQLNTQMRKAKGEGDAALVKKIQQQIRDTRRLANQKTAKEGKNMMDMEANQVPIAMMAQAATRRRAPRSRPDHPENHLRTSELPTPANSGSTVAQFGGTDAESPSSAHTDASVPQILRLLNGQETNLLTDRGRFANHLRQQKTAKDRLQFLFLSIYATYPSKTDQKQFLSEVQTPQDAATLARAMLTSNRFLFVQ